MPTPFTRSTTTTKREQARPAKSQNSTATPSNRPNGISTFDDSAESSSQSQCQPDDEKYSDITRGDNAETITEMDPHATRKMVGPYRLSKTLGQGSMGKVKLAIHTVTGEKRACKIIPSKTFQGQSFVIGPTTSIRDLPIFTDCSSKKLGASDSDESREIRTIREAAIMLLLRHPHIASLDEILLKDGTFYLFLEYVNGGQMLDFIISHGKLKEKHARKYIRQIVSAIDYCHQNSIVHRDLKIENVLIDKDGSIKLIDFGLSNLYSPTSQLRTFCGSLYFAAPELLCAKAYTGPEVDIWSLGVIIYVLVCGKVPFDDASMPVLHAKIKTGTVEYPPHLSSDCRHLLSRLLVTHPSRRATMDEIKSHPWMTKGYDGPPSNYLPSRERPSIPLDAEVIQRMKGFDFGTDAYLTSALERYITSRGPCDPLTSPLVSIYCLVKEKLDRERQTQLLRPPTIPAPAQLIPTSASSDGLRSPTLLHTRNRAFSDATSSQRTSFSVSRSRKSEDKPRTAESSSNSSFNKMMKRFSLTIGRPSLPQSPTEANYIPQSNPLPPQTSRTTNRRSTLSAYSATYSTAYSAHSSTTTVINRRPSIASTLTTRPGRADENIRTVFLKGLFSVVNSSTKSPSVIRRDLLRVLTQENVTFVEYSGGFECEYIPIPTEEYARDNGQMLDEPTPRKPRYSFSLASIRKSLDKPRASLSSLRWDAADETYIEHQPEESLNILAAPSPVPLPKPPAPVQAPPRTSQPLSPSFTVLTDNARTVRLEIVIVRIPWLKLHGVQFRKLLGDTWQYKALCTKILESIRL